MPALTNVAGTWDEVKKVYANVAGTWKPTKAGWRNVGGVWEQFHANHSYEVYSLGLQQIVYPAANRGLWMDGAQVFAGARSYNIVLFDNFGNISDTKTFDVFGDNGSTAAGSATANMISYLNGLNNGQLYLIFTYDEPQMGAANLTNVMSATMFGNQVDSILTASIAYRGAYICFGYKGQEPCVERWCGTESTNVNGTGQTGTADGVFNLTFQIYSQLGPQGKFANLSWLYQGGTEDIGTEAGTISVAGI
jgi:hypothetical protein